VDYLTSVVYVLHFGVTLGIGMLLWTVSRRHFFRYSAVLLTLSMASFVIFLIVPTAPPWWASDHNFLKGMDHILLDTLPTSMSPYYQSLNPNPVAALPSLHSAFPMIGFLALRQVWPRLAFVALAWCALVWFSVVYLGEHYVVDVAVGVALGTACWFLVDRFGDRLLASLSAGLEPLRLRLGSPLQGSE
jgi:membrane-associated phospholipid phosphatase